MSKIISVGKIIDATWDFYVKNFRSLMRVTFWLFLVALASIVWTIVGPAPTENPTLIGVAQEALFGLVIFIITAIVGFWVFITLLQAIDVGQKKANPEVRSLGKKTWSFVPGYTAVILFKFIFTAAPLILIVPGLALIIFNTTGPLIPWLSALGILLTFVGVVAAFVLVVYVSTLLQYAEYLYIFENRRGMEAIRGARNLVVGRFWPTLWRIIVPKIVFFIPVAIMHVVLGTAFTLVIPSFAGANAEVLIRIAQIGDSLVSSGIAALTTPLFVIADYYVYQALKKTPK